MRTGLDLLDEHPHLDKDVASIMSLFVEDAVRTACKYAEAKSIESIGEEVMRRALKYEAMHFFERGGLEERFVDMMREDDETSEDESKDEEQEELTASDDEDVDIANVTPTKDVDFCAAVDAVTIQWDEWVPQDPVQALIKRSIVSRDNR